MHDRRVHLSSLHIPEMLAHACHASPCPPSQLRSTLVPTHAFEDSPDLDVLIILEGMGCFDPDQPGTGQPNPAIVDPIVKFIKQRYSKLQYLVTVCTGAFSAMKQWRPEVQWVHSARWVVEGNIWTSSGVCARTDLTRM